MKRKANDKGHKEELDRIKRDLAFANERAEDSSRNKSSEVSGIMSKYNRQLTELEDSLRVSVFFEAIARWIGPRKGLGSYGYVSATRECSEKCIGKQNQAG